MTRERYGEAIAYMVVLAFIVAAMMVGLARAAGGGRTLEGSVLLFAIVLSVLVLVGAGSAVGDRPCR